MIVARTGDVLDITLDRPPVRNALDHLVDAFRLAAVDDTISEVHLRGTGAAFCAGGDLDELGSFTDPASAHLLRLQQSAGRAMLRCPNGSPRTSTAPVWDRASSWPSSLIGSLPTRRR